MHLRLHLVRFMYINLLLSCCFWVYDNVAAEKADPVDTSVHPEAGQILSDVAEPAEDPPKPETSTEAGEPPTLDADSRDTSEPLPGKDPPPEDEANLNPPEDSVPQSVLVANEERENTAHPQVPNNQFNSNNNTNDNNDNRNGNANDDDDNHKVNSASELVKEIQQPQELQAEESFPEIITELPSVTVTELPLDHLKSRLESVILDDSQIASSNKTDEQSQDQQVPLQDQPQDVNEAVKEVPQKDEQMPKINDPGGGADSEGLGATEAASMPPLEGSGTSEEQAAGSPNATETAANLTQGNEEVPMPVFSEWAQKQIEAEASREQAMELEQQVVNKSAQRKNNTGSAKSKPPILKLRSKNYASPDCGAKIIAHNAESSHTSSVLTVSKDEYMLSTCEDRIWLVVELCEAIQAQKVDLANFELFSSSPKNFSVAVSKRFPTRDWSNVGRFEAADKRTIQTFELHPHLFGKFVRLDITSHYASEHFCPLSLFRVFGTSEYEAFETEIRPSDEVDDFYDDFGAQEQKAVGGGGSGGNIFQSASDAVMQMVKKAAEVLVKPKKAFRWSTDSLLCRTPIFGAYSCASCNSTLVEKINSLISCQFQQLQVLLSLNPLRWDLLESSVCQEDFGIDLISSHTPSFPSSKMGKRQSYFLSLLPAEHVGAMCKMMEADQNSTEVPKSKPHLSEPQQQEQDNATAKGVREDCPGKEEASQQQEKPPTQPSLEIVVPETPQPEVPSMQGEAKASTSEETVSVTNSTPADVNIFNVPAEVEEVAVKEELPLPAEPQSQNPSTLEPSDVEATTLAPTSNSGEAAVNGDLPLEDGNPANWENIDNLLTTTVASITAGGGAAAAAAAVVNGNGASSGTPPVAGAGVNLQQKLTNGAQSESVFIRLSNRIKALERNMSLSGQYLEELSRRYKKQVEELQQTLTQQTVTVRQLEDQSRHYADQEQLYQRQSAELAGEVRALTYQVQACILVIIIVGTCIFLMLVLGTVYYRKLRRQQQQLKKEQPPGSTAPAKPKLDRRKSYEQMLNPASPKKRRPSEEAMLILKECGDNNSQEPEAPNRQRKISVCYGSNNNIAANMLNGGAMRSSLHRRKGAKHSWHNSLDTTETSCTEHTDKFFDVDTLKSQKLSSGKAGKKKSQPHLGLKRQESAPATMANEGQTTASEDTATQSDFDESLMLDDDDLANFIPTSDLAYNEFMPEGPSGYQILDTVDGKPGGESKSKKSRRLSSPAFFKSPFSKNKNKGYGFNGLKNSHSVHEPTSWEWYRLKRSEKQQQSHSQKMASKSLPGASLDNSSLSEVNFPLNEGTAATQNSFRILGEAILSSGEGRITPNGNGNGLAGSSSGSGSGSGSGGSTTSSTTKKKQRAFNSIFRKAFDF